MVNEKKVNELDLLNKWRQTQNPQYFQALYQSMKPLIHQAAEKAAYGSNIPESAHKIWAAQHFLESLRTYNPDKGALGTHVYGSVQQKAKRLNYMYQNLGHMPEPRAAQVGLYQTEHANMRGELGREPSAAELADRLAWSLKNVSRIQKEIHKDLAMADGTEEQPIFETSKDEEILNDLYYDLTPEEQVVYDHVFGRHGKMAAVKANRKVDFDLIGRRSAMSPSKTRSLWVRVRNKLDKALKR